jgi:glucose/arabinose dehydrogenase
MPATGDAIRKFRSSCLGALILLLAACGNGSGNPDALIVAAACLSTQTVPVPAPPPPATPPSMTLSLLPISTGFAAPLFLTAPPGDTNRLFVVEQGGVIKVVNRNTNALIGTFLTISGITTGGEQGLLGLAFHPNYSNNGFFYVNVINSSGDTEIRRYTVMGNPANSNVADPGSSTLVITISQLMPDGTTRFGNHKAGWLGFGPDGLLYAALGDGGSGGDPFNRAQNLGTLLGKMLRLNVDVDDFPADATRNYGIPADNPCVSQAGALGEIWSMGLRNPWRPSFDRGTGDFYIADVGQGAREEVNVATAAGGAGRGTNYGWKIMEGTLCFSPASGCDMSGLQLPSVDYAHTSGACSITGGYVYRGTAIPALQGTYFYADFCVGFVRSFKFVNGQVTEHTTWASLDPGANLTSFGEDAAGELYIMTSGGELFRIVQ